MIDKYDDMAKASGARIVHFCGHDCVPWDLLVMKCAEYFRQQGDELTSIHLYDELPQEVSGGTLATVFFALSNRKKYQSSLGFDPLLKTLTGEMSAGKFVRKLFILFHRCHVRF